MKTRKRIIAILLIFILVTALLPFGASAAPLPIAWGAANCAGNFVRIRSGPGIEYDILTHMSQGDAMVILERTSDEWYKVNFNGTVGYVSTALLDRPRSAANFNATGKIVSSTVRMRERPNTDSAVLGSYAADTTVSIIGINEGWYKVQHDGKTGYIRSDLLSIVSPNAGASPTADAAPPADTSDSTPAAGAYVEPTGPAPDANTQLGQQIADLALTLVGSKYVAGGASPSGFDCSGFTFYIYRQFDIKITRNASGQYRDNGVHIEKSDLAPGDLVFTSSNGKSVTHVGIYIGDNKMVHASTARTGVIVTTLDSSNNSRTIFGAKRVV